MDRGPRGARGGFLNWQGVLNNAYRLRGEQLFYDMLETPGRARHLFDCVSATMTDAARRLHARQRSMGAIVDFFTVSNCLVNLLSPVQYRDLLLPFDRQITADFGCLGIHNCAWRESRGWSSRPGSPRTEGALHILLLVVSSRLRLTPRS